MSVRLPQNAPRPGVPTRSAREEAAREQAKPAEAKKSDKSTQAKGTGGKPATGGKTGARPAEGEQAQQGAQGGVHRDGMDAGAQRGGSGGLEGFTQGGAEALGTAPPTGTSTGMAAKPAQAAMSTPAGAQQSPRAEPQAPAPTPQSARESSSAQAPREQDIAERAPREETPASREGRARVRAAVMDRLMRGYADLEAKLSQFVQAPGRHQGVVTVPIMMSESSITLEFWAVAAGTPEDRAFLTEVLGVPANVDDAYLLELLREEIHLAFDVFQRSEPGKQVRAAYEAVLTRYDAARIQTVIEGHDTGPMVAECARLQLTCEPDFTRSLLLSPGQLAVARFADEGSATQVMVAGLTLQQLGSLVGHLRTLNPMLSNAQVRTLLFRASTDLKLALRKPLGDAEVERVQELAKQLLRLQAVELLFV
ncbi:hypothetical protein LXT21_31400 [Myxococcus sp. K38C18041901]|uniref:hypothetical protein n=1 Tax=Myxococcus guangdongensis TaxID=2906760 RepID=UPI0020A6EF80|nr:hypothetical protein [Myxococcus guangdongensis]MCP3063294.1 hypothetical protein [Myxococcus guangdongensis]